MVMAACMAGRIVYLLLVGDTYQSLTQLVLVMLPCKYLMNSGCPVEAR